MKDPFYRFEIFDPLMSVSQFEVTPPCVQAAGKRVKRSNGDNLKAYDIIASMDRM